MYYLITFSEFSAMFTSVGMCVMDEMKKKHEEVLTALKVNKCEYMYVLKHLDLLNKCI